MLMLDLSISMLYAEISITKSEGVMNFSTTRREMLKGSLALGAVTLTGGTALARVHEAVNSPIIADQATSFNCEETHQSFATLLDAVIEAPHIDGEHTMAAMMEAHCPFCEQLVAPKTSKLKFVTS